ncbi:MAG TPA: arylsulfotransferase family protein [Gaiellaceae bacterium]|nr:arylsulfotransferase family protein [Gaiellaceae bacterium]
MRGVRTSLVLVALLALTGASAGHTSARRPPALVRITSTPALWPRFSPSVRDYVVRCTSGTSTRFTAVAAAGSAPLIDGVARRAATLPLAAGQGVTIEARNARGVSDYHVRCLPADFPGFTETRTASTREWYVATPSLSLGDKRSHYIAIFDGNGVPVWWYKTRRVPIDAKLLPDGNLAFASFPADTPEYQVRTLAGRFVRKVVSPDGRIDDHDLQVAGNGDFFYILYQPKRGVDLTPYGGPADATVLEAAIEEITPDGKLVWSWTTDGRVDVSATGDRWIPGLIKTPVVIPGPDNAPEQTYDFFHPNAVSLDGGTVLFSVRHTDAVYAIDKATGNILWQLGGKPGPQSLTVVDDPYGQVPLGGQHDVRLLPDGTISVFDDGTFLNRPPRAVRYRIDAAAHTATLVQSISDPTVTTSICCGSARMLRNGDWVISWGGDPVFGEYRPDGTPVFRIQFDGLFSYRVVPVSYAKLGAAKLRAAMDALAKR